MSEQPVYAITPKILTLVEQIGEAVGRVEASGVFQDLRLQRINRVRQIHGTLAMAGNSLSEEQISAILDASAGHLEEENICCLRNCNSQYQTS